MVEYKSSFNVKYNDGTQEKSIYHNSMTQDLATFDIVSANGYKITKIDTPYYNDTDFSGHPVQVTLSYQYQDTKVDDTHHKVQFYVTNGALATFHDNPSNAFIYVPVTTEKAATVQPVIILIKRPEQLRVKLIVLMVIKLRESMTLII